MHTRSVTKRTIAAVLTAGVAASLAAACGGGSTTGSSSGSTFVFGSSNDPRTLDPAFVYDQNTLTILNQIYEPLVKVKPGGTDLVPSLADKWETAPNGLSTTFSLHTGVKFQDGTDFNAAAVCFNFDRMYNFKGAQQTNSISTYWQNIFGGFATNAEGTAPGKSTYKSCDAPNDTTAILNLTTPNAAILPALGSNYLGMVSPTAVKKYGDGVEIGGGSIKFTGTFGTEHPTGTGPFKFESFKPGDKLTLSRFDGYWGDKAKIGTLIYKPIADGPARRQALENGEIDGYDAVDPQDINALKSGGFQVLDRPAYDVGFLNINQNVKPLDNPKVREAMIYALNRQAALKSGFAPGAQVADQFVPPASMGYNPDVQKYDYNPDKAKQLLAESGDPHPTIEFWYPSGVSRMYMPDPKALFEAFKADLEKVGFTVNAKTVPWTPDYVASIQTGKTPLAIIGRIGVFTDPSDFLDSLFTGSAAQRIGFNNPEVINGLAAARAELNPAKRTQMYKDINAKIMQLLPGIPYVNSPTQLAFKPGVTGYVPSPVGQESMATVSLGSK